MNLIGTSVIHGFDDVLSDTQSYKISVCVSVVVLSENQISVSVSRRRVTQSFSLTSFSFVRPSRTSCINVSLYSLSYPS